MDCLSCINDILNIITVCARQHTNLINIWFYQCRTCFDSHFKKFATGIKDHRFAGFFYNFDQSLICSSIKTLRYTSGHGNNICILNKLCKFLFESLEIFFSQRKSRFQKFCLDMIHFIPDIDAGSAFRIYMIKLTFDSKRFQSIFNIVSCVATYKSGCYDFCTINRCRLGYIETFASGNVRTFPDTVYFAYFKIIDYISFIDCSI